MDWLWLCYRSRAARSTWWPWRSWTTGIRWSERSSRRHRAARSNRRHRTGAGCCRWTAGTTRLHRTTRTPRTDRYQHGTRFTQYLTIYHSIKKGTVSQYSITERRVPELISVLGSQPAGDVSHKPGGRLPLLSARPAVTPATLKRAATTFAAWWTEAQWAWAVCLRLLPDTVATAT